MFNKLRLYFLSMIIFSANSLVPSRTCCAASRHRVLHNGCLDYKYLPNSFTCKWGGTFDRCNIRLQHDHTSWYT